MTNAIIPVCGVDGKRNTTDINVIKRIAITATGRPFTVGKTANQ
jgi:hypothetical protein